LDRAILNVHAEQISARNRCRPLKHKRALAATHAKFHDELGMNDDGFGKDRDQVIADVRGVGKRAGLYLPQFDRCLLRPDNGSPRAVQSIKNLAESVVGEVNG
jgi:hypothetical protein